MAILLDELTVWEISFRWAGHDPDKFYYRIPLSVRDNFRLIIDQIYSSHLSCDNLSMEKYLGNQRKEAKYYLRYWMPAIEDCLEGLKHSSELLKFARVSRSEFQEW